MNRVIRLNDETIRLVNLYRKKMKEDMKKNKINIDDVLEKDNIVIQSALRFAIEFDYYLIPEYWEE